MDSREKDYSIFDFETKLVEKENGNYYNVFFKKKLIFEVEHLGDKSVNKPSLAYYITDNFNYYLEKPFIIAGGYNNSDLYDINGNKLTDLKLWSLSSTPMLHKEELYFAGASQRDKWGIIDSEGNTIIPFEYDSLSICLDWGSSIKSNGLLYVTKNKEFGVIDLKNNIVHPFTKDWNEIRIKQLKDLNLFDEKKYVIKDGILYDKKYF